MPDKKTVASPHADLVDYYSNKYYKGEHKEEIKERLLSDPHLFDEALKDIHKDSYGSISLEEFKTKYKENYGDPFSEKKKSSQKVSGEEPGDGSDTVISKSTISESDKALLGQPIDDGRQEFASDNPAIQYKTPVNPLTGQTDQAQQQKIDKALKYQSKATDQEIREENELKLQDTGQDRATSAAGAFDQKILNIPADLLELVSIGGNQLINRPAAALGLTEREQVENDPAYKLAQQYREITKDYFPDNPAFQEELGQQASTAAADLLTMVAGGMGGAKSTVNALSELNQFNKATSVVRTGANAAKELVASPPAVIGALQTFLGEFQQAKAAGASDDEAFKSGMINAPIGAVLENVPVASFLQKLNKATDGGVVQFLKNGVVQGVEEMSTEVIEQMLSNLNAKNSYDKTREILDGVGDSGIIGFGLGSVMGALGTGLRAKLKEAKTPKDKKNIEDALHLVNQKLADLEVKQRAAEAHVANIKEKSRTVAEKDHLGNWTAGQARETTEQPNQDSQVQEQPGSAPIPEQQVPNGEGISAEANQGEVIPEQIPGQPQEQVQEQAPAQPIPEVQAQVTEPKAYSVGKNAYSVTKTDNGVTVINRSTGTAIDRKSKAYDKVIESYKEDLLPNTHLGKLADVTEGMSESDFINSVSETSENPEEIALAYLNAPETALENKAQIIKENLRRFPFAGLQRFGDKNNVAGSAQIKANYIKNSGTPLDVQAQEMSEATGVEITPEDILEFVNQYPSGQQTANVQNEIKTKLTDRFRKVTGVDLDSNYANKVKKLADLENQITSGLDKHVLDFIDNNEISLENIDNFKAYFGGFPFVESEYQNVLKYLENGRQQQGTSETSSGQAIELGGQSEPGSESGTNGERNSPVQGSVEKYGDKSKSPEETVKEINGLELTHVTGLNMGSNQTTGTYISTEAENRYAKNGGTLLNAEVNIKTPLQLNSINDFVEIQRAVIEKNFPDAERSVDNLSDTEFNSLAGLVAKELQDLGYDSVYFPESEAQEGELIVFDRANVTLTEPGTSNKSANQQSGEQNNQGDASSNSPPKPPKEGRGESEGKKERKQGVKSVYRNVIEKSTLSQEQKTYLKANQNYNVLTNKESAELAEAFIKEFDSAEEAAESILSVNTDVPMQGAVKSKVIAAGITELTNKYNSATDPIAQEDLTDRQSFLIDAIDNLVRDAGQTIESIKSLYKATELGIKKAVQRKIKKYNDKMSENLGLSNVTEESFALTFENAAEATAKDPEIAKLQQEILELKKDLEKARAEKKEKQKAEKAAKKKTITDRLEKNKNKFKKIDWLSKGDMAMSSIIPIPLNPEKIKALAILAKDYIELGAVNASEVYAKLNEYIKEVTDGKGFLNEKDFAGIYNEAEKIADKALIKDINKEIKEQDIKLAELAREYYTDQENIGKSIKDELVDKLGLTGQQAEVIGKKIDKIFKEKLHAEQLEQLSKKYSSKIPVLTNNKKKTETMARKLLNEINLGTLNFDVYEQLFAERHNLISYNKESKAIIDGIVKRINNSPTGTLRNRAEVELLDYIVSLQKKSLYKLGVSYMYTSMLSSYQTHLNNSVFGFWALTKQIVKRLAIPTQKNRTAVLITFRALNQAVLEARDILRTGYREQGTNYVQQSDAMIKGNKGLKALSMAFRGLAAEDVFFNVPLTNMLEFENLVNMRMRDEAYKQSKDKNYKPISTKEIVEDVNKQFEWSVKNNKTQEQAANDVVANKGLTEPLFKTRLVDYTDNNGNPQTKEVLVRNPYYADSKHNDLYRLQKLRSFEILEQERDENKGYQQQREIWAINQVNQEREAVAKEKEKEYKPAEAVEDFTPKERQNYAEILGDHSGSREEAKLWANEQLLMGTPKGDLGILSRYLNTTIGPDYPGLKMIVIPFVNVPFNSANYLIETSPIGTATLAGKYLHHVITGKPMKESFWENIAGEGTASARLGLDNVMTERRKRQLISRQAMFYGGVTMAWMLTQLEYEEEDEDGKKTKRPWLQITANGKGNWFKNEELKRGTGDYKEWTANLMGFQFNYRYSPFAGIFAPLGMLSDYEKYGKKSTEAEVAMGKKVALVSLAYGAFIYEALSLKGLADLFSLGSEDTGKQDHSEAAVDKAMRNAGKWVAKQSQKLIPASGLLKALNEDIAGIIGADDKVAIEWYEFAMREIPGLDQMLTTKTDHLGRPVPSVTDVPFLYNGNYKKDEYYSICTEFGYENSYYWKFEITNPKNTKKSLILTQKELTELNKDRGTFAYKELMERTKGENKKERGIDLIIKKARLEKTEALQREVFDKEMDKVFTEATRKAKIAWFKKNQ